MQGISLEVIAFLIMSKALSEFESERKSKIKQAIGGILHKDEFEESIISNITKELEKHQNQENINVKNSGDSNNQEELKLLIRTIIGSSKLYWAYKSFFLQGETETFKKIYVSYFKDKEADNSEIPGLNALNSLSVNIEDLTTTEPKPSKIHLGFIGLIYTLYATLFYVYSIPQLFFSAAIITQGVVTNALLVLIFAAIATAIAITVSQIKEQLDCNKTFNLLLLPGLAAILLNFTAAITPLSIIYALCLAAIIYNGLSVISHIIKEMPLKPYTTLRLLSELFKEITLTLLLIPSLEPLFAIYRKTQISNNDTSNMIGNISAQIFSFAMFFSIITVFNHYTCCFLAPELGIGYTEPTLNLAVFTIYSILYKLFTNQILKTRVITLHSALLIFTNYIAGKIIWLYEIIPSNIDYSQKVAALLLDIFSSYRKHTMKSLTAPSTNRDVLYYIMATVTYIIQAIIDATLFPIFILLYLSYNSANNMERLIANKPAEITAFIALSTIVLSSFANPIQLFVLGNIVMNSPILFGATAGIISIMFAANIYTISTYNKAISQQSKAITSNGKIRDGGSQKNPLGSFNDTQNKPTHK